jgi:hypothetical protein
LDVEAGHDTDGGGTVAQPTNQIEPTRSLTGSMASTADRATEQHHAKLREIQRHLEARSLTVRKMTAEERKRYPPRPPKTTAPPRRRWVVVASRGGGDVQAAYDAPSEWSRIAIGCPPNPRQILKSDCRLRT